SASTQPRQFDSGLSAGGSGPVRAITSPSASSTVSMRPPSSPDEVPEKLRPRLGQETLGMILDALERVGRVADAHDLVLVGLGHDDEIIGEGAWPDDQAVVAGRLERVRQAPVDALAVVVDHRGLAVHDP